MEYYVIRIYRREAGRARRSRGEDTAMTGLLEDGAGGRHPFRNAEELWRLLALNAPDVGPERGKTGAAVDRSFRDRRDGAVPSRTRRG